LFAVMCALGKEKTAARLKAVEQLAVASVGHVGTGTPASLPGAKPLTICARAGFAQGCGAWSRTPLSIP
jgi:hypothetical protein